MTMVFASRIFFSVLSGACACSRAGVQSETTNTAAKRIMERFLGWKAAQLIRFPALIESGALGEQMAGISKETGIKAVLAKRMIEERLPKALALKERIDRGGV